MEWRRGPLHQRELRHAAQQSKVRSVGRWPSRQLLRADYSAPQFDGLSTASASDARALAPLSAMRGLRGSFVRPPLIITALFPGRRAVDARCLPIILRLRRLGQLWSKLPPKAPRRACVTAPDGAGGVVSEAPAIGVGRAEHKETDEATADPLSALPTTRAGSLLRLVWLLARQAARETDAANLQAARRSHVTGVD